MNGYYYLHTNGDLIWKPHTYEPRDFDESDFVRKWWRIDTTNRADAWRVLLEGLALGADINRVRALATAWKCNAKDLVRYMIRVQPTQLERTGITKFIHHIIGSDPDKWFDWLGSTPKGAEPNWETMP